MDYVLETEALGKRYKQFPALNGLNMHVPKGSIYGLVGKNGAGKTTLIRIICGLQEPSSGSYTLCGCEHRSRNMVKMRRRMGAEVDTPAIYPDMSARENLEQQYRVLGLPSMSGVDELLKLVGLSDTGRKKAGNFSLGMRQRLGIAVALCGGPDFLVLDEPINGLDPEGIVEIRELILRLNRQEGITILISSHILDELSRLATHYGFIDRGTMVKEISARELEQQARKAVRVRVSDTKALLRVCDRLRLPCELGEGNEADVFGEVSVAALVEELSREGCTLFTFTERDENLESFYMNLLGGERHA